MLIRGVIVSAFLSSFFPAVYAQAPDSSLSDREAIEANQEASEDKQRRHAKSMRNIRSLHQRLHENRLETSRQETDFLLSLVDRLERIEQRLSTIEEKMPVLQAPQNKP